jgi:anti-sigma B factor antagonist
LRQAPHLEITSQDGDNGISVLVVTGRLMLGARGSELEGAVRDVIGRGIRKIIFDFAGVEHIDSTGIGRCIASLNLIMQAGGSLAIAGATGQVREGFRVTQLDRVFRFYDDVSSARAALA